MVPQPRAAWTRVMSANQLLPSIVPSETAQRRRDLSSNPFDFPISPHTYPSWGLEFCASPNLTPFPLSYLTSTCHSKSPASRAPGFAKRTASPGSVAQTAKSAESRCVQTGFPSITPSVLRGIDQVSVVRRGKTALPEMYWVRPWV